MKSPGIPPIKPPPDSQPPPLETNGTADVSRDKIGVREAIQNDERPSDPDDPAGGGTA